MCDHVWDFRGKDAEHAASPATMRHVRCIPNGTKVPRTGHIDMRTSIRGDASHCRPHMGQGPCLLRRNRDGTAPHIHALKH
jgi:hypothetical protein